MFYDTDIFTHRTNKRGEPTGLYKTACQ